MRIEQINEEDKITLRRRRKNIIVPLSMVAIIAPVVNFFISTNLTNLDEGVSKVFIIATVATDMLMLGLIFWLWKRVEKDLAEGKKEVFTGAIRKKMGGPKENLYYFVIDEKEMNVDQKIYAQYSDNQILDIEQAPNSKHVLGVHLSNEKN